MSLTEQFMHIDDIDPIDIVEHLAEHHEWDFDRIAEDRIAMVVDGQWRTYSISLSWAPREECLRLVSTFELAPPEERLPELYEVLNAANDACWAGAFTYWDEPKLMVYRYGLVLAGGYVAGPEQIDRMIASAVAAAERFYPAFQLVCWGGRTPADAMQVAIAEAYGTA
ncbi:hypothetical protein LX81_00772 [Palleronia aestuarii]|uniref:Sensory transduction regulator n=1 Tax=Palleronia aestuarii TaxID=568105 RepID=A0A2W7NHZ5_9RHOB|nr:YbjN domain-containing protein [Palleronia aestuarii]PZX19073.1 hypothetical protein LX81_00772 [Palleronia aestuarii]